MDIEVVVMQHGERLSALEEATQTIKQDVHYAFLDIKEVKEIANENNTGILLLQKKMDNGISSELKAIKEKLEVFQTKKEKEEEREQDRLSKLDDEAMKEIKELSKDSWFVKLGAAGVKKAILVVIGIMVSTILLSAGASNSVWYFLKKYQFQEVPGMVKSLVEMHQNEYHMHKINDSLAILHANNPDLPAWKVNLQTHVMIPYPAARTDEGLKALEGSQ